MDAPGRRFRYPDQTLLGKHAQTNGPEVLNFADPGPYEYWGDRRKATKPAQASARDLTMRVMAKLTSAGVEQDRNTLSGIPVKPVY